MRFFINRFSKTALAGLGALWLAGCQASSMDRAVTAPDLTWPALVESSVETRGFTTEGLAKLDDRIEQFVTDGHVAGIATLLVKDGQVIQYNDYGVINPDSMKPVGPDTIYRIYSMTKPITGVAMMMLYEEGRFSLEDPVTKFIPEFSDLKVLNRDGGLANMQRPPTMREVMSHTAGFAYGLGGNDPANTAFREQQILNSPDLGEFVDRTSNVPLLFQPGQYWSYSAAVDIQGAIIERISGQSLGEFFKTRIFEPLNMDDTGFYVPEAEYERFSDVFGYHPETGEFGPYRVPQMAFKKETIAMESGGGGLVSTMDDYARFCQMLANGGSLSGVTLLKPETVKLMRTNVLPEDMSVNLTGTLRPEDLAGIGFGLNFGVIYDAEASSRPYGQDSYFWGGMAGTWFWIDPTNNLFYIGMIQRFPTNGPSVDFRTISGEHVYEALSVE